MADMLEVCRIGRHNMDGGSTMEYMELIFTMDELKELEAMCIAAGAVNDNPVASDMWAERFRTIIDMIEKGEIQMQSF